MGQCCVVGINLNIGPAQMSSSFQGILQGVTRLWHASGFLQPSSKNSDYQMTADKGDRVSFAECALEHFPTKSC